MEDFAAKDYWEKRLEQNWGIEAVGFAGYGKHYNKWLYRVRKIVFNRHVRSLNLAPQHLKVLDVGSGTGFYLNLWRCLGVTSVTGSDLTSVAVERLKKAYPEFPIIQFDLGASLDGRNWSKDKFDVVTAFDVLFHIVEDDSFRRAFFNISQLLIPGGYFIFSENFLHGKTITSVHQVNRDIEKIRNLLEEARLRIVKRSPMFVLMNAPLDTGGRWQVPLWRVLMLPVRIFSLLGFLYGGILFPLEIVLTGTLKESESIPFFVEIVKQPPS